MRSMPNSSLAESSNVKGCRVSITIYANKRRRHRWRLRWMLLLPTWSKNSLKEKQRQIKEILPGTLLATTYQTMKSRNSLDVSMK